MRTPRIFLDQNHAEMMVYALENHFERITALLDGAGIPDSYSYEDHKKKIPLTVEQRVCILIQFWDNNVQNVDDIASLDWEQYLERAVHSKDDTMDYDPEELAVMLHDLHEAEKNK